METRAPVTEKAQESKSLPAQAATSAAQPKAIVDDSRPEAVTLRSWQSSTRDSVGSAQLKGTQAMMASAVRPSQNGTLRSGRVLQSVFIAEGEKRKKIRQWVGATKSALQKNGDVLLLDYFVELNKSENKITWNIREEFSATLARLKVMKKNRDWADGVKNSLRVGGEELLLDLFIKLLGKRKTKWDISEEFAVTRWKLRQLLEAEDNAPITTILDDEHPTKKLRGDKSAVGGGTRLAAWDLDVDRGAVDPATHTEFSHVTTSTGWMDQRLNTVHGAASGELGAGFYTVSGHVEAAAKGIRDEFGKTGNVPREVLTFRIENVELGHLVNDEVDLAAFLIFILQRPSGYPPGVNHMALITRINRIGKALIFPDKATLVDVDTAGHQYSYDTYRAANGAVGGHSLIVGPQARESLDGIRQIAARGYLGDQIFNEAARIKTKLGPIGT